MKGRKLAVAAIALATLIHTPKAEAKSLFNNQQILASKVTAQVPNSNAENNTEADLKRGIERLEKEDYQGAIDEFNKVLEIEPKNIYAYVGRGAAKMYLKQYQSAKSDFDTALEITPDISLAYYFRGITNYVLQDKPAAMSDDKPLRVYADLRKASTLFKQENKLDLAQKADSAIKEIEAS
ncbi:TPR repeat-containing protein [Calothrix sp. NIES-2100]|uniref:tetratricopeptide repeat protein n=1 Tax=Calothrix sp. NIES-2100 TaxID=1954172 RepID=UPI000B60700E|nr:TPR repeat-containing protein [Calothrix sp. NIES-2100]